MEEWIPFTIDPTNGSWTWVWNAGITTVTSNDADVKTFFKITTQTFVTWISTGFVDLTGPQHLLANCPELHAESYFSVSAQNQSYICSFPVNNNVGDLIVHEPTFKSQLVLSMLPQMS